MKLEKAVILGIFTEHVKKCAQIFIKTLIKTPVPESLFNEETLERGLLQFY